MVRDSLPIGMKYALNFLTITLVGTKKLKKNAKYFKRPMILHFFLFRHNPNVQILLKSISIWEDMFPVLMT